jgi:tetratricopeptide (TPR) repeat protein
VLLYELLTGTTPFDAETLRNAAFDEMRRIIREQEPQSPSVRLSSLGDTLPTVSARRGVDARRLGPSLRGELDWVVMKALEKDRRRRYETANDFAADVMRYLTDQPVQACPPSAGYRLRKFVRRNKGPVAAGLALAALLLLGTVGTSIGLVWSLKAERRARNAEGLATDRLLEVTKEKERATAAETKAMEEAAIAKAVKDFLQNDLLGQASPFSGPRRTKVTVEEVLGRAAARIAGKFAQQPRIEAEIQNTIASAYHSLGDLAAAQPHKERALEIGSRAFGEEDPHTLSYMNNLACLYMDQGKFTQAEPLLVKVVEIKRRKGEEDLTYINNLGYLYLNQREFAEAEQLLVRALEVARRRLGEESPTSLDLMDKLASAYGNQGRLAQAETLHVKVLEARRRLRGEEDFDTLDSMKVLASLYMLQGRLSEAEPLLVKALEGLRRLLGREHPETIDSMRVLADLYLSDRKHERSIPLLEDTLRLTRDKLGPGHLRTMDKLGENYLLLRQII